MLLFSRATAARRWGWRDRMRFVDHECDERLRELLMYVSRKAARGWALYPFFRQVCGREGGGLDVQELRMLEKDGRLIDRHVAWHIDSTTLAQPPVVHRRFMYRLMARFPRDEEDEISLVAFIYHMGPDPYCHKSTEPPFYYIHVHDWIARCACTREVVALLDAVQRNAHAIRRAQWRRVDACRLHDHLRAVLERGADGVRKAYVERRLRELDDGDGGLELVC